MLDDLIKNSENDEELIAFLLEYANYFTEEDLNSLKECVFESEQKINIEDNTEVIDNNLSYEQIENISSEELINVCDNKKVLRLNRKFNSLAKKRKKVMVHKIVEEGIENHVPSVCVKVYNKLLDKNIFVKNFVITDTKIRIVLDKLSEENKKVFDDSCIINPRKYIKIGNNNIVEIQKLNKSESTLKNELVKATRFLKMQDVQIGFVDKKKFLMHFCDCEKVEGHTDIEYNKNLKIMFDENKMEKSFEEYLADKRFDSLYSLDNKKIYLNEYYYNAHQRYLEFMNNNMENDDDNSDILNIVDDL